MNLNSSLTSMDCSLNIDNSQNELVDTKNYFEERLDNQFQDLRVSKIKLESDSETSQIMDIELYIEEGKKRIQEQEKSMSCQGYIIILGNTGIGKTTTANFMCGTKMTYQEIRPGKFAFMGGEGIGNTSLSCTISPNIWKYLEYLLIDCPGINDNRGQIQDIINAFFTSFVLDNNKKKKFIVAISYNIMLDNKLIELIELAKNITQLLGDIENYKNSLIFQFTIVPIGATVEQIKEDVRDLLKTNNSLKKEKEFLSYLSSQQSKVYLFYKPISSQDSSKFSCPITKGVIDSVQFTTEVTPKITIAPRSSLMVKKFQENLKQKLNMINNTIFFENIYPQLASVNQSLMANQNMNKILCYIKSLDSIQQQLDKFYNSYNKIKNTRDKSQIFLLFEKLINSINDELNLKISFEILLEQIRQTKELFQFTIAIDETSSRDNLISQDFITNLLVFKDDIKNQKKDILFSVNKQIQKKFDETIEKALSSIQKQIKEDTTFSLEKLYYFFKTFSRSVILQFEASLKQKNKTKLEMIRETVELIQKEIITEYQLKPDQIEKAKEQIEKVISLQQLENTIDIGLEVFQMCLQKVKQEYEHTVRVKIQQLLNDIEKVIQDTNQILKNYYADLKSISYPYLQQIEEQSDFDHKIISKFRNFYNIFKEYSQSEEQSQKRSTIAQEEFKRLCKTLDNKNTFDQSGVQTLGYAMRLVRLIYENLSNEKKQIKNNSVDIENVFRQKICNIVNIINDADIPKSIHELITYKDVEQITNSLQQTVEESLKNYEHIFTNLIHSFRRIITSKLKESIQEMKQYQQQGKWIDQVKLYRIYNTQPEQLYQEPTDYIEQLIEKLKERNLKINKQHLEVTIKYSKILKNELELDEMKTNQFKEELYRNIFIEFFSHLKIERSDFYKKLNCIQRLLTKF